MSKTVTILFGEMGSGKSYWGKKLSRTFGDDFFEGDSAIPDDMLEKVNNFQTIPRSMIENYLSILLNEIEYFIEKSSKGLVVSQALYKDSDRLDLANKLKALGYTVNFIWIKVGFIQNMRQLYSRENGLKWVFYWLMSKPFFQNPTHFHTTLPG